MTLQGYDIFQIDSIIMTILGGLDRRWNKRYPFRAADLVACANVAFNTLDVEHKVDRGFGC